MTEQNIEPMEELFDTTNNQVEAELPCNTRTIPIDPRDRKSILRARIADLDNRTAATNELTDDIRFNDKIGR